jgi:carboxypeptidase Taq
MPAGGARARALQIGAVAEVLHGLETSAELGKRIAELEHETLADEFARCTLSEARRRRTREAKVPAELARRMAEANSSGYAAWEAKHNAATLDSALCGTLRTIVEQWKEKAGHLSPQYGTAYDLCLDEHERGLITGRAEVILDEVKVHVLPLIQRVVAATESRASAVRGSGGCCCCSYPASEQETLWKEVATDCGFDFDRGRLDQSPHPFTTGIHPTDVRITNRIREDDLFEGLYGVLHEAGHALYEQGLPMAWAELPAGQSLSMGAHESQSLFWEWMVGLSRPFWARYTPRVAELFPECAATTAEEWYRAVNTVVPGLHRMEADDLTYSAHILVRFEMERDMFSGRLPIEPGPLRQTWAEKMRTYLGVEPTSDCDGILQDSHWFSGLFGYFPSYTLGAMTAAQLHATAKKQLGPCVEDLAEWGRSAAPMAKLRRWLLTNVHQRGAIDGTLDNLLRHATGSVLDPSFFFDHLTAKYADLYGL